MKIIINALIIIATTIVAAFLLFYRINQENSISNFYFVNVVGKTNYNYPLAFNSDVTYYEVARNICSNIENIETKINGRWTSIDWNTKISSNTTIKVS